jgi:hypothetical protein
MTEHGSFYRKITYVVLIAVLLFPISQLGAPATVEDDGGRLAQLRAEYQLGQSNLGEIDPASETIRLATLGLRGVAVSLLWNKAEEYKKKEDWTNFRATLDQLSKLQPYFIKFWQYQAWNLSYNVSVELDDVRDRFHYVKRGIEFLQKGIKYNRNSPYLLSELGWFIGNKIGRADESKEYRRLFKADEDFHPADRPPAQRDNWLVSRSWYERSVEAVVEGRADLGQKNPTTFFSDPGRSQINYSEAIENEGVFGEKARAAWVTAGRMWKNFGTRDLMSSMGFTIRMLGVERIEEENQELAQRLEAISEATHKEEVADKRAALTAAERALLEETPEGLSDAQRTDRAELEKRLEVSPEELAERIAKQHPEQVAEAQRIVKKMADNNLRMRLIHTNSEVVNYAYWAERCAMEQTPGALRARDLAFNAEKVFRTDADLLESKRLYEESFDAWAEVFLEFPGQGADSVTGSDIMVQIEQYITVLEQLDLNLVDEEVGRNFPLWSIVRANDRTGAFRDFADKFLTEQKASGATQQTPRP